MKAGKAAGLDGCAVQCLKSDDTNVTECLVTLLMCVVTSMVSVDWTSACKKVKVISTA